MMRKDEYTAARDLADGSGCLLVHVTRERGTFSVTSDLYATRAAYEAGNEGAVIACGQLTNEIRATFPELAPLLAVHLCDVQTGEPMHALSNAWYRLSGADMAHDLDWRARYGHGNYYSAPEPHGEDGKLRPEYVAFFRQMAADSLHVDLSELPNDACATEEDFRAWFEASGIRARWQTAADQANALIDRSRAQSEPVPAEQTDEEEYDAQMAGGLRVRATLMDEEGYRDIGPYFRYRVVVSAGRKRYTTEFGSSVNDYYEGTRNARQAAFGVLRELMEYEYESAEDLFEGYGYDPQTDRALLLSMRRQERAFDRMRDALVANKDVIG